MKFQRVSLIAPGCGPLFAVLLCFHILLLSGCAPQIPVFNHDPQRGIELVDTPFFAQKELQCGPAALAMVLRASGIDTDPEALSPQIFLPDRHGTLQLELVGAVRRHDRIPYTVDPEPDALVSQLIEGRPVLLLQDLGVGPFVRYHYSVLVGILPGNKVILRSGAEKRLVIDENDFVRTWRKAGSWGLVALRPGELPRDADADRYVKEISALEALGRWDMAEQGYRTALARWPQHLAASFGLGNTLLVSQKYSEAETIYRQILAREKSNPAVLNNLAEALLRQGRHAEALEAVERGLSAQSVSPALAATLRQTRGEIMESRPGPEQ